MSVKNTDYTTNYLWLREPDEMRSISKADGSWPWNSATNNNNNNYLMIQSSYNNGLTGVYNSFLKYNVSDFNIFNPKLIVRARYGNVHVIFNFTDGTKYVFKSHGDTTGRFSSLQDMIMEVPDTFKNKKLDFIQVANSSNPRTGFDTGIYNLQLFNQPIPPITHNYQMSNIENKATDTQINDFINKYNYLFPVNDNNQFFRIYGSQQPITKYYDKVEDKVYFVGTSIFCLNENGVEIEKGNEVHYDQLSKKEIFTTEIGEPNSANIIYTYQMPDRYLIETINGVYKYNNQWIRIGDFIKEELFYDHWISALHDIPESAWKEIKKIDDSFNILRYSKESKQIKIIIKTPKTIYQLPNSTYNGIGVIQTELEELPDHRQSLIVHADHTGCLFKYSLDDGDTWYNLNIEEVQDITKVEGNELIIRVHLPSEDSELRAISYGWA